MASQVMRITLKAYDHQLVDQSAGKIIETVKKTGFTFVKPCVIVKEILRKRRRTNGLENTVFDGSKRQQFWCSGYKCAHF